MRRLTKHTLRSKVAAELFQAIVSGTLQPGERIYEENLAHRLGVAKTTLREALQNLEHRGLITKYERRGSFVTKLMPKDIEEAYDVRLLLEPYAAALAHQRMDTARLSQLRSLLEEIRGAGERRDFVRVSERDALFHQLIWRESGNGLLARQLRVVCFPLWAFELIRLFAAPTYSFDTALDEHRVLLDVLEKGDSERVRNTFREILVQFRDQDLRNLQALESKPSQRPKKLSAVTSATEIWQAFFEQTHVLAAQQSPT
jgi:DNA-binding GntR family transcriptional regulator